jgi:hypothetical protein
LVLAVVASLFAVASASALARSPRARVGNVYTLTNAPGGNEVLIFDRWSDGSLSADGSVPAGGLGTGAGLGSQGALILDGRWLLAVNAGSDDISMLNTHASLQVRDVEPSGGDMPISVTIHGPFVYVLNTGSGGNISGFRIDKQGDLTPIPGSPAVHSAAPTVAGADRVLTTRRLAGRDREGNQSHPRLSSRGRAGRRPGRHRLGRDNPLRLQRPSAPGRLRGVWRRSERQRALIVRA